MLSGSWSSLDDSGQDAHGFFTQARRNQARQTAVQSHHFASQGTFSTFRACGS